MKMVSSIAVIACLLSGCISSSSPPAPQKNTTVIVPQGGNAVCQDGSQPPCK